MARRRGSGAGRRLARGAHGLRCEVRPAGSWRLERALPAELPGVDSIGALPPNRGSIASEPRAWLAAHASHAGARRPDVRNGRCLHCLRRGRGPRGVHRGRPGLLASAARRSQPSPEPPRALASSCGARADGRQGSRERLRDLHLRDGEQGHQPAVPLPRPQGPRLAEDGERQQGTMAHSVLRQCVALGLCCRRVRGCTP